jgi:DNA-binding GntR family transcriptional regulator
MADVIPIRSTVLHEQVARKLRAMLVEGRIAAGSKLNERELSERLQVSRTPLREAIRQLAAEGLVALKPHRGAVAIELDEAEVQHSFELMAALEGLSGELAAQRINEAELQAIRALHFEMMAAFTRRDLSAYYRLNAQIHAAINAAAKNPADAHLFADQSRGCRRCVDRIATSAAEASRASFADDRRSRSARRRGITPTADHAPASQA